MTDPELYLIRRPPYYDRSPLYQCMYLRVDCRAATPVSKIVFRQLKEWLTLQLPLVPGPERVRAWRRGQLHLARTLRREVRR